MYFSKKGGIGDGIVVVTAEHQDLGRRVRADGLDLLEKGRDLSASRCTFSG